MTEVLVDLVIAVHTARRPIARAVASVLDGTAPVRVTVVAHNLDPALIEANLAEVRVPAGSSLRVLDLQDGTRSPAGPFNHGLDMATAPFVAVMGSDDRLAPGAVASWLALQRRTGAVAVLTRLARAGTDGGRDRTIPTPPVRPGRRRGLDGTKDRLAYRSAPLGLLDRSAVNALGLRFTTGLEVGEDVPFVLRLYFSGRPIAFDRGGPAYLIEDDAGDRVTLVSRPVATELRFVRSVLEADWFAALGDRARAAICVKLVRIHLFGLLGNRTAEFWTATERAELAAITGELLRAAPGCEGVLSRADRGVLDAIDPGTPVSVLMERSRARRRHGRPETLVPREPGRILAREAPLRFMLASALTSGRLAP